jgi:Bacterial alpha-L-rhamnosidase C-terminal domain
MLEQGATTFWETWDNHNSLCHAWSATPTFDLSNLVLGISPAEDKFNQVQIAPHFLDLAWARGNFPTPLGAVAIDWSKQADGFEIKLAVPAGMTAAVVIPFPATEILVNGKATKLAQNSLTLNGGGSFLLQF